MWPCFCWWDLGWDGSGEVFTLTIPIDKAICFEILVTPTSLKHKLPFCSMHAHKRRYYIYFTTGTWGMQIVAHTLSDIQSSIFRCRWRYWQCSKPHQVMHCKVDPAIEQHQTLTLAEAQRDAHIKWLCFWYVWVSTVPWYGFSSHIPTFSHHTIAFASAMSFCNHHVSRRLKDVNL